MITVYQDRSFTVHHQDAARVRAAHQGSRAREGSGEPNKKKVGKVTRQQVEKIAELKMPDLNASTLESAVSMVVGTARSMGIDVV